MAEANDTTSKSNQYDDLHGIKASTLDDPKAVDEFRRLLGRKEPSKVGESDAPATMKKVRFN